MDSKRKKRRLSIWVLAVLAVVTGLVVAGASSLFRPEVVRQFWATATWQADGQATATETIDYHFSTSRHGIYRVLPGIGWTEGDSVKVTADHTDTYTVEPDLTAIHALMAKQGVESMTVDASKMSGVRVRIGDPGRTISGNHRYTIEYPLSDTQLGDGRFGWDGVGTTWDVPINHTELDLVAPWEWEDARCDVGSTGSVGGCEVTQPVPGRLQVSHGRLDSGEGITVYATAGRALAAAPQARVPTLMLPEPKPWERPVPFGAAAAALMLLSGLLVAKLLRRAGRDWVMAGPASTDSATDLAFGTVAVEESPAGATRVDDTKLGDWAGTEFAPPRGLAAWQGGTLVAEKTRDDHKVAWLLEAAAAGCIDLEAAGPAGSMRMVRREISPGSPYAPLLEIAFAGRDHVDLGRYNAAFSAMWATLGAQQHRWLEASPYVDHRAEPRVKRTLFLGVVACLTAPLMGIVAAVLSYYVGWPAAAVVLTTAALGGAGITAALRAWELHVRTPAGSAMWLRVESFRRFLAASEAEHVREAAARGVLREYSAWAVALGEVDHWNEAVQAAGLPPTTPGLASSLMSSHIASACTSTAARPTSSGSGSSGGGGGGGGGVGGGGGGGGGGSW